MGWYSVEVMNASANKKNKTILINRPNSDQVMLVISIILDPVDLDLEGLLAAMVPEMAKGAVRGGILLVGDSALLLRNTGEEMLVDEVDTHELFSLAGIEGPWDDETIVGLVMSWVSVMAESWRDRLVGRVRELMVPHLVAGLGGDMEVSDGAWGLEAHRVAATED